MGHLRRMNAWVLVRHGPTERAFALREIPDPVAGRGQVLIRSEGFGLNYADVMARKGLYREAPPPPCIIGYEAVGRVEYCGDGVPAHLLGRRVVAITRFGGYAEMAVTDHRAVVPIDDSVPLGTACALATQGATAWYLAMIARPVRKGEHAVVHSAAGGVGNLLVQLLMHQGGEVIAMANGADKVRALHELGIRHVIDRARGDYAEQVRTILKNGRSQVVFNAVGGSTFKKDLALLGATGCLVLYGGAARGSGTIGALRFVLRMGVVIPILLMMRHQSLIGVNMLRLGDVRPDLLEECLHGIAKAHADGWLRPMALSEFPSEQLPDAHTLLESGRSMGKVVVRW